MKQVIITADDLGLTRAVTDSILACADNGALTQVSMLTNGFAFDYAVEEFAKRAGKLDIALHLNLVEGRALSSPHDVPHLTDSRGVFRFSPGKLWLRYIFALPKTRRILRREVALEVSAQWQRLQTALSEHEIALSCLDGHLHAHMIPFVFDEVAELPGIKHVRLTIEPFYFVREIGFIYFGLRGISRWILGLLAKRNARIAMKHAISTNIYLLGFVFSGRMTYERVRAGLSYIGTQSGGETEIVVHPGNAERDEIISWEGDISWHLSPARAKESEMLHSNKFTELLKSFAKGDLPPPSVDVGMIYRFLVAGGSATVINLGLLYLFTSVIGIWYVFSALGSYLIAFIFSFILQKFWTFNHRSLSAASYQLPLFFAIQTFDLIVATYGLYLIVEFTHIWYLLAETMLLAIVAIWNYFFFKFVVFRHQ